MPSINAIPYKGNYILTGAGFPVNSTIRIMAVNGNTAFSLNSMSDGSLPTNYYLLGGKGIFSEVVNAGTPKADIFAITAQGVSTNTITVDTKSGLVQVNSTTPGIINIAAMNTTTANHTPAKHIPSQPENVLPSLTTTNPLSSFNVVGNVTDNVVAGATQGINPATVTAVKSKPKPSVTSQSASTATTKIVNPN